MPKICYENIRFGEDRLEIIKQAAEIAAKYASQGYRDITARQIYYQFIARDILPDSWIDEEYNRKHKLDPRTKNTDKNYERLAKAISDGRIAGLIDWDHITDVTRGVKGNPHWKSPAEIIEAVAEQYHEDLWRDNDPYVEVWIEKDALVGIIRDTCIELDVPFFACRGYTSSSSIWLAAQRILKRCQNEMWDRRMPERRCLILHFGDHDPSGIDMTRDIQDRLNLFVGKREDEDFEVDIEVRRVALTMAQIRQYRCPPAPAKATDGRSRDYVKKFGRNCWELDALEPNVLNALVRDAVQSRIDYETYVPAQNKQEKARGDLLRLSEQWVHVVDRLKKGKP